LWHQRADIRVHHPYIISQLVNLERIRLEGYYPRQSQHYYLGDTSGMWPKMSASVTTEVHWGAAHLGVTPEKNAS